MHAARWLINSIGKLTYKLEIPAEWHVHDVFHVSNLKPSVIIPEQFAGRPTRAKPVAFARDGVSLYEPEAILDRMWLHFPGKSNSEWGYLIQWKDFSEHDTTWEPLENLYGSKLLLEAYNTLHPFFPFKAKETCIQKAYHRGWSFRSPRCSTISI